MSAPTRRLKLCSIPSIYTNQDTILNMPIVTSEPKFPEKGEKKKKEEQSCIRQNGNLLKSGATQWLVQIALVLLGRSVMEILRIRSLHQKLLVLGPGPAVGK